MHFVFLNQYYPPDAAPTGVMLKAVAEALADQGHHVSVLCATGGYATGEAGVGPGTRQAATGHGGGEVHIVRLGATRFGRRTFAGKLADYAGYYLAVGWKLAVMRRPERVVALTTPPYLSVLARALSKLRGATHAHWVMDLYPDVMTAHGMLRENGPAHRILRGLARWGGGGGRGKALLTIGPDMAGRLRVLAPDHAGRIEWVPLWGTAGQADPAEVAALRARRGWRPDEVVVMYSGNMGLGHRFGEILEAIKRLCGGRLADPLAAGPAMRFVFFGGGKRRVELESFVRDHPQWPVELHDYAPANELGAHLATADVHLVSLEPSWTGTMVPSKLQGIFAAGRPAVFIGDGESSIGCWLRESGGGWWVGAGDPVGLAAALEESRDPARRAAAGRSAADFAARHFDQMANVARITEILGKAD